MGRPERCCSSTTITYQYTEQAPGMAAMLHSLHNTGRSRLVSPILLPPTTEPKMVATIYQPSHSSEAWPNTSAPDLAQRGSERGAWQNDTTSLQSSMTIVITDNINTFLPDYHHHQAGRLRSKIYLPNFSAACARSLERTLSLSQASLCASVPCLPSLAPSKPTDRPEISSRGQLKLAPRFAHL